MLRTYILLFIFLFPALHAQTYPDSNLCKGICGPENKSHIFQRSTLESAAINNNDIVYHRCYWEIDPSVKYVKGAITSYFKPTSAGGITQLEFDLLPNLIVDSVIHHMNSLLFTREEGDILRINFSSTLSYNILDSLTVYYQGEPSDGTLRSFIQSTHSGAPIVWTLSEPYGAKTWWPCKQNLVDKIDSIDILVKTSESYRAASNGILISELKTGNQKTYYWKSRYPIAAYLVAIAVTNYVEYSDLVPLTTKTLQVLNYVYPESLTASKEATKQIVDIIQFFDSLLIEYPFAAEKYGHAQFGAGGGMEHQTMSFMVGFYTSLMAHECAHQWFGDYITCGSWEDIWLNEGFASYFEWLVTERYDPTNWHSGLPGLVRSITSQPGGSVMCDDTTQASRIFDSRLSYSKGAFLLRMLRWKIGDDAFFKALKNYLNDPALKTNYAKTPQLIKHFEKTSGQDLSVFFNQWYYKQGHPGYRVIWLQSGNVMSFTIAQTQSHPSVSFFEMPVELKFLGLNRDTTIVVNNTLPDQSFSLNVDFKVISVRFDPELRLISAGNAVLGFNENDLKKLDIVLYPNPSDNEIKISGIPQGTILHNISIINALGQFVYEDDSIQVAVGEIPVNISTLRQGVYTVLLNSKIGRKNIRFIKRVD